MTGSIMTFVYESLFEGKDCLEFLWRKQIVLLIGKTQGLKY